MNQNYETVESLTLIIIMYYISDLDAIDDELVNGDEETLTQEDVTATASSTEANEPPADPTSTVHQRRELLDAKLKDFRQQKLKRKLPVDAQLLDCAREELHIKRRLVEQMDRVDKQQNDNMVKLTNNMEKLTNSIADGFSLLRTLLAHQTQPIYPPYQPSMYNNTHPLGDHQRPSQY